MRRTSIDASTIGHVDHISRHDEQARDGRVHHGALLQVIFTMDQAARGSVHHDVRHHEVSGWVIGS